MSQTFIKDLTQFVNQEVILKGWLNHKRSSGSITFLELRWIRFIQCSFKMIFEEMWEQVEKPNLQLKFLNKVNIQNKKEFLSYKLKILIQQA